MSFYLTGQTYEIKDILKTRFNAKWDKDKKQWHVSSAEIQNEAQAFIDQQTANKSELRKEIEAQAQQVEIDKQQEKLRFIKTINELSVKPSLEDKRFIRSCVNAVLDNEILLADRVHQYRSLANQYEEYFKVVGLPYDIRNRNQAAKISYSLLSKII